MPAPEPGLEPTLNLQMIDFQIDGLNLPGKIAPDVAGAYFHAREFAPLGLRPDQHAHRQIFPCRTSLLSHRGNAGQRG